MSDNTVHYTDSTMDINDSMSFDLDGLALDFDNMVDFTQVKKKEKRKRRSYDKNYDDLTKKKYKAMRKTKECPISGEYVDERYAFKVKYMWDPITGEYLDKKDPYGPLMFDPIALALCFYMKKTNNLLSAEVDEGADGGYYEAIPGDALGAGENINIPGRGEHPELFLWRLPVNDCYLEKGLNRSIPIKGPKLSRSDVVKLYELCRKSPRSHWSQTFKQIPNLVKMYDTYMIAIDPDPDTKGLVCEAGVDAKFITNLNAAKVLESM